MAFTTIDDSSVYFQTKLYTGNGGTNAITNTGNSDLQPDWIWFKRRDGADNHILFDVVRGVTKGIYSDLTNAEDNLADSLASFNSDGFTLGADTGSGGSINGSNETNVAWQWKAGTSFTNDASSTGIGTIDSSGSVNNDSGFSIVSYTGNATDNASVKHGLNTAPKMVIIKDLSDTSTWGVWHQSLTNGGYKLTLNSTAAQADDSAFIGGSNRAIPTSSVFFLGSGGGGNGANANIAYCFAEKQGYSKFNKFVGTGNANGTFCYTGMKSAFIMLKRTDGTNSWCIFDNKRLGRNPNNPRLYANNNNASEGASDEAYVDILSNGFKLRGAQPDINASGGNYIYMAFAENPFVTSTGVPATAR